MQQAILKIIEASLANGLPYDAFRAELERITEGGADGCPATEA